MEDKEILKKAIEKVIKNGFEWDLWCQSKGEHCFDTTVEDYAIMTAENLIKYSCVNELILSHGFAKAYFGKRGYPDYRTLKHKWIISHYDASKCPISKCKICKIIKKGENIGYENCSNVIGIDFLNKTPCLCGQYNMAVAHGVYNKGWEYYLSQTVLEKDRLQYIKKFL